MDIKSYRYFINRLKITRCKQNISLEKLGKSVAFSKGHMSKIENYKVILDNEYLKTLSISLGFDYYFGDELLHYTKLLDEFYTSIVFYRIKDAQQLYSEIEDHNNIYLNSDLVIKYTLYSFLWHTTISAKVDMISKFKDKLGVFISEYQVLSNSEMQIYHDCIGCNLMDNRNYTDAINQFTKALGMGIHKYSYSMVCYHLGKALDLNNNFIDAKYYESIALRLFMEEININRQLFTQVHIATIYGKTRNYEISENMYNDIINKCIDINNENFIDIVLTNLSWLLIKQKKYNQSLKTILSKKDANILDVDNFHLIICYYYLKNFEKAQHIIDVCKYLQNIDELINKKIIFFEIIIKGGRQEEILVNLKKLYKEIENHLIQDEKRLYIDILIDYCKELKLYKDAFQFAYKLIELNNN